MAQQQPPAPVTQQRAHRRGVMVGKASFCAYAVGATASGTPYHRDKLTAASRVLPFGTRLRVTDLNTNKSVEVTVTDRGPASRRHHCWTGVVAVHSRRPVLAAESVSSPGPESVNSGVDAGAPCQYSPCE